MKLKIKVIGAVQGVGFRPFVLRLATEYGIRGYVKNLGDCVEILAIGENAAVYSFIDDIREKAPAGSVILDIKTEKTECEDHESFEIVTSTETRLLDLPIFLPDIGICDECIREMLNPSDRRYRYPLISCAGCGPRISILNRLPYDRCTTTMHEFEMCPDCSREYKAGRRTHAQTISCHNCGPYMKLEECTSSGISYFEKEEAVNKAILLLKKNEVIGLKGVSGYQLIGKPNNEVALKIRQIKGREKKPFAIMFSDTNSIKEYCFCNEKEEELLKGSPRPIVLLNRKKDFDIEVCKDSRYTGAFLPSSGIHRLLTDAVGPLIVTSANISDEPIIINDDIFRDKFLSSDKAVAMLYHDRKINIPQDDSVIFVNNLTDTVSCRDNYKACFIRRSRGYAPLPVLTSNTSSSKASVLAFGGDLKNTFSFGKRDRIVPSPYIGDLKDYDTLLNEKKLIDSFSKMYDFIPDLLVCDMHPLYQSSTEAMNMSKTQNLPLLQVQHHHAHILSVMAENSLIKCIGVALDGTGFGTDEKIWGGEILLCNGNDFQRLSQLKYVKLCGGDNAPKNAMQVRQCYEYALYSDAPALVKAALDNNIGTFMTSSCGRLFDAVSSLLEIRHENSFEGECATLLEAKAWEFIDKVSAADDNVPMLKECCELLSINIEKSDGRYIIDQLKFFDDIRALKESDKYSTEAIAYAFHMALAGSISKVCCKIRCETGENNVCLSGGVFANRLLLRETIKLLSDNNFDVYSNEAVPSGDAGISLGQAYYGLLSALS